MTSGRRSILAWCLYDFANSPFTTLVVTFLYATYFTRTMATTEVEGTALWSRGVTLTAFIVALLSPLLGAVSDRGGHRKRFLLLFTVICASGCAALHFITPETPKGPLLALATFIVANVAFEMGMVFYNAFLPDIAPGDRIGRVSGYGWALGYGGGLLALVIALVGFVQPDVPWFGFSREGGENIRATTLLAAIWLLVFSIPLFLFVRETPARRTGASPRGALDSIATTFREIRRHREIVKLLSARLLYNDGLVTIFAFGGIYAQGAFGFEVEKVLIFGIVLNVAAGLGAFFFGLLDDRLGGKTTILLSLLGLMAGGLLAVLSPYEWTFWIAGTLVGIFSGPNQAASRSLLGRFVPDDKESEFFGFFAFSGKATTFLGPLLLGILVQLSGSLRVAMSSVVVFFVAGGAILLLVNEKEGIRLSGRDTDADTRDVRLASRPSC
jgi:UMF1 family MFS transporter